MKFALSTAAIVATIMALLPNQVESVFMQFVNIDSQTISLINRSNRLSARLLIDGKGYSISGSNSCFSGCTNKFCSKDGVVCAQVLEDCNYNAGFQIYYANTCRYFTLKRSSECGSTNDKPKQSWKGVLIDWQDFDFYSGRSCPTPQ